MLISKQQSLLLALQLAGLVAGNAPQPCSAVPSLAVPSSCNAHTSGARIIEEVTYTFTRSIPSSTANPLPENGNPTPLNSSPASTATGNPPPAGPNSEKVGTHEPSKILDAREPNKTLPDVTSVENNGLSAQCYTIHDECDKAVHQFIEDGWYTTTLKAKTARYSKFNSSAISGKCIVSYKCDNAADYGDGLTGKQVYDM